MSALVESVRDEDLRIGDMVVMWCGRGRIVEIEAYKGALRDVVFAIARVDTGRDFSLIRGGWTDRVKS